MSSRVGVGFPWIAAFALASPAIGLAFGAGFAGIDTPVGAGLLGVGAVYLAIELLVLQPKVERRAIGGGDPEQAAQEFLQRALSFREVEVVAEEFGRAITLAMGPTRCFLLAPGRDGEVRVLSGTGEAATVDLGDPTPAFLWLGDAAEPIRRSRLVELEQFEGARDALALIDALGCDVLLPLLHRGLLLGLGLVKEPPGQRDLSGFFSGMRAYMTVAVANTFLDAEARGRSELAKSFDLATTMQESLMPDERPVRRDGFELKGLFKPVAACGGDLWAWRELSDGKVLLLVADATGHGAAPALLAAVAKGAIDAHWQMGLTTLEPDTLLTALNTAIHRTGRKRYMMTAFAAVVDTVRGELRYANAGQNFPYFIHGSGEKRGKVEPLIARGNSLGAASEAKFERHTRPMTVGDKLILFTDGVTEAGTPWIEQWGEKRFRASLVANANKRAIHIPELIMSEVDQHLAGRELMDDVTMLAFEYGHTGEKA
ncbi:MAG TPA: PP2C family protein-serine/threonine phosphatase [Kofleriaceae bacterium]|nr:PP2C family protein-serine/threonine phosphatase [Kofleriaceae bacterium]